MTIYYFDTYLPHRFAAMLRSLDVPIAHPRDVTEEITKTSIPDDQSWLTRIKANEGTLISVFRGGKKDKSFVRVLHASGVKTIFLPAAFEKLEMWEQAKWLIRHWQEIETVAQGMSPGTLLLLTLGARVEEEIIPGDPST